MTDVWAAIVRAIPSRHVAADAPGFRGDLLTHAPRTGRYLEIGCRLGHSLACVLRTSTRSAVVVDAWIPAYAGEANDGPARVLANLTLAGVDDAWARVTFCSGESHTILSQLLAAGASFDLITVDGDHTPTGQAQDLRDALALLAPGGTLIVDDAYDSGNPDGPILTTCLEVLARYPHTVDIRIGDFAAGSIPWLVVTAPAGI